MTALETPLFVDHETIQRVLDACPSAKWRAVVSLCRFGGLRCPSEILCLTWGDILWDSSRIVVTAPKTAHHKGHEQRVILMFPELQKPLLEVAERSAEKVAPVITRYRSGNQNLRTTFNKIVKRAGIIPWPKPFQNLRSTRETELMETYPSHVVCKWIGNSEAVARKHYLQVTDAHFEKAVQPKPSDLVGHMVGHNMCETTQTGELQKHKTPEKPSVFRGSASHCAVQNNPTRARTWNDRTKICCVTITPSGYGAPLGTDFRGWLFAEQAWSG